MFTKSPKSTVHPVEQVQALAFRTLLKKPTGVPNREYQQSLSSVMAICPNWASCTFPIRRNYQLHAQNQSTLRFMIAYHPQLLFPCKVYSCRTELQATISRIYRVLRHPSKNSWLASMALTDAAARQSPTTKMSNADRAAYPKFQRLGRPKWGYCGQSSVP